MPLLTLEPELDLWLLFHENKLVVHAETGSPLLAEPVFDFPPEAVHLVEQTAARRVRTARLTGFAPSPDYRLRGLRELLLDESQEAFRLAATALQVLEWDRNHRFCSHCGSSTVPHPKGERAKVCPVCEYSQYPRIQPCVIVAITRDDHILLARAQRYNIPMYSLLAGFVEVGETLEEAVAREVAEESGVRVDKLCYFGSQSWPFPSNLMLAFRAEWAGGDIVIQEEEIMDAQFFHYRNLPMIPPAGSIAYSLIMAAVDELTAKYG
ncbi:NAD+ diphosphatase [Fluviicoccus keumensis]|uniref:NAD(+) diphosphatase n=1 Tax=Fluviicoccus keumensis TaxID=1435465 RepID=A0A4Q7YKQ6_9GAMM|nr:NAD(+) diphosphatase [Fluviicoccus keumensis]RZU37099.1 NAD+ diphosphatase [Fluviicoccus keumensis]